MIDAAIETVREAAAPGLGRSIGPLLPISLALLVGFMMLQSFGIIAESAKAELNLSDTALGAVQGVSAAIPLVIISVPIGIWVDRRNRVLILISMAIGWTIGTFTAAAPNTAILFLGRMLTSIGQPGGLTAVLSLGADYCRPDQCGRALDPEHRQDCRYFSLNALGSGPACAASREFRGST